MTGVRYAPDASRGFVCEDESIPSQGAANFILNAAGFREMTLSGTLEAADGGDLEIQVRAVSPDGVVHDFAVLTAGGTAGGADSVTSAVLLLAGLSDIQVRVKNANLVAAKLATVFFNAL